MAEQYLSPKAIIGILFVFIGCCSNVVFLELLVKAAPGCGSIVTCCQFIFIAIYGFIFTMKLGSRKNVIPIKSHLFLGFLFMAVNEINNRAFAYKISVPLHIIFRSAGLVASMIMGMIVLQRRYTLKKYVSVFLVTFGTVVATFASSKHIDSDSTKTSSGFTTWLIGIAILTFALFLQARMGIFQECLYKQYGKHPDEAVFFFHLLSLPGFLLSSSSIYEHTIMFAKSAPITELAAFPVIGEMPKLWLFCIGNAITQYLCVSSVFILTSECSALTATMVLTLRKFMSLVFSIIYFKNTFTIVHWLGAFMVFGGTILFTGSGSPQVPVQKKKD